MDADFIRVHLCSSVVEDLVNPYDSACPWHGVFGVIRATLARPQLGKQRLAKWAQFGRIATETGVARQSDQQFAAREQGAATGTEGACLGTVVAVGGARRGQAGETFRCARSGAASPMHTAAAVGHGGRLE